VFYTLSAHAFDGLMSPNTLRSDSREVFEVMTNSIRTASCLSDRFLAAPLLPLFGDHLGYAEKRDDLVSQIRKQPVESLVEVPFEVRIRDQAKRAKYASTNLLVYQGKLR
jgi:hypothetical protein